MKTFTATANEIKNVRFLPDDEILIGSHVLSYVRKDDLINDLKDFFQKHLNTDNPDAPQLITPKAIVRKAEPEDMTRPYLTMTEHFCEAVEYYLLSLKCGREHPELLKVIRVSLPYLNEISFFFEYDLCTAENVVGKDADMDSFYEAFLQEFYPYWISAYMNETTEKSLIRMFFLRFFFYAKTHPKVPR